MRGRSSYSPVSCARCAPSRGYIGVRSQRPGRQTRSPRQRTRIGRKKENGSSGTSDWFERFVRVLRIGARSARKGSSRTWDRAKLRWLDEDAAAREAVGQESSRIALWRGPRSRREGRPGQRQSAAPRQEGPIALRFGGERKEADPKVRLSHVNTRPWSGDAASTPLQARSLRFGCGSLPPPGSRRSCRLRSCRCGRP